MPDPTKAPDIGDRSPWEYQAIFVRGDLVKGLNRLGRENGWEVCAILETNEQGAGVLVKRRASLIIAPSSGSIIA